MPPLMLPTLIEVRNPVAVVESWVACFNAGDGAGIEALYHDDAVTWRVTQRPVRGAPAIRAMWEEIFGAPDAQCIIVSVIAQGRMVALEWSDPFDLRGCAIFEITGGRILSHRSYWDQITFGEKMGVPLI